MRRFLKWLRGTGPLENAYLELWSRYRAHREQFTDLECEMDSVYVRMARVEEQVGALASGIVCALQDAPAEVKDVFYNLIDEHELSHLPEVAWLLHEQSVSLDVERGQRELDEQYIEAMGIDGYVTVDDDIPF